MDNYISKRLQSIARSFQDSKWHRENRPLLLAEPFEDYSTDLCPGLLFDKLTAPLQFFPTALHVPGQALSSVIATSPSAVAAAILLFSTPAARRGERRSWTASPSASVFEKGQEPGLAILEVCHCWTAARMV